MLSGNDLMTLGISEKWGQKANDVTNKERVRQGLEPLEWSSEMHRIAYLRTEEVAQGKIPFG